MTYQRDLKKLIASLDSLTDGQAAVQVDEENICKFTLTIIPNDGPYRNGKFDFEISVDDPDSYPVELPEVICTTLIYHPNIDISFDDGTNVCLSLFDEWTDSNNLADIVQGLLFLFYNPNIEDPLSSLFDVSEMQLILQDKFTERVRMSLMGELEVDGVTFTRNQVTDDDSPPGSYEAVKTDTPCSTESVQETNDTPHTNINDDDVLAASTENPSYNDINILPKTSEVTESDSTAESIDRDSNLPSKTSELVTSDNYLHKQDSICKSVNSEPSTSAIVICPTLKQQNYQTWNKVLGAVTILIYIGFVNCDQHAYEILR